MRFVFVVSALVASALAADWTDTSICGRSQYDDAGIDGGSLQDDPLTRIIGGWEARPNELPWTVVLRYHNSIMCGAVIINSVNLLTAAHCTEGTTPNQISVRAGSVAHNNGGTIYTINRYVEHEDYDSVEIFNDISLIYINGNMDIGGVAEVPACAPRANEDYIGKWMTVSGWGTTSYGGPLAQNLRYVSMPTIPTAECQSYFPPNWIIPGMVCAGVEPYRTYDSCNGDSGGPMAYKNGPDNNHNFEVIGLVSWGIECVSGYPGAYVDVQYYLPWIAAN